MDFEKLADKFIEEGGWQGSPRIAIELFAKWLAEQEAAKQSVHLTAEPSGKIETNIDEDALHQWVYGTTRRK